MGFVLKRDELPKFLVGSSIIKQSCAFLLGERDSLILLKCSSVCFQILFKVQLSVLLYLYWCTCNDNFSNFIPIIVILFPSCYINALCSSCVHLPLVILVFKKPTGEKCTGQKRQQEDRSKWDRQKFLEKNKLIYLFANKFFEINIS